MVYWATPKGNALWEATAWPRVSRTRTEIQENSFKRMMDHGALHTNAGRKRIVGPARPQQRAREQRAQSRAAAHKRVHKQSEGFEAPQAQVAESGCKGHGKRLAQRQRALAG